MTQRIKVQGIKKKEPNYHLYVLALIALAQELQKQDDRPSAEVPESETSDQDGGAR